MDKYIKGGAQRRRKGGMFTKIRIPSCSINKNAPIYEIRQNNSWYWLFCGAQSFMCCVAVINLKPDEDFNASQYIFHWAIRCALAPEFIRNFIFISEQDITFLLACTDIKEIIAYFKNETPIAMASNAITDFVFAHWTIPDSIYLRDSEMIISKLPSLSIQSYFLVVYVDKIRYRYVQVLIREIASQMYNVPEYGERDPLTSEIMPVCDTIPHEELRNLVAKHYLNDMDNLDVPYEKNLENTKRQYRDIMIATTNLPDDIIWMIFDICIK